MGIRWSYEQREVGTMEIEQAFAAGRAVGEVSFNALIIETLTIEAPTMEALTIETPIIEALIIEALTVKMPIYNRLILQTRIIEMLISDALMLATLGRFRSRAGNSIPVVFNLSIAQMLRLFSHWTHISLI